RPDGRQPDVLTTARDVDRLIGLLACQPGGAGARVAPHPTIGADRVVNRELVVGVAELDVVGSIGYVTPEGAWYVQGKPGDDGLPIIYPYGAERLEFPDDALVPLELVGMPIKDFLVNGGSRRPPNLAWRA